MTTDEAVRFINKRFTVGWPFKDWGMHLEAKHEKTSPFQFQGSDLQIAMVLRAPHRDTGERGASITIHFSLPAQFLAMLGDDEFARFMRSQMMNFVIHELDESILVDGKRVFDPHAKESK